jgi:hypothetical protein
MFAGVELSTPNYDALLEGWNAQNLQSGVIFGGGNSTYCTAEAARLNMINSDSWTITDGGKDCTEYEIMGLVATNNSPTLLGDITMMTATITLGTGVTYDWDFGDSATDSGAVVSHVYGTAGVFEAEVTASNAVNMVKQLTFVTIYEETILSPGGDMVVTSDGVVTLETPAEITRTITLTYTPQISSTQSPDNFSFAGVNFQIEAVDDLGNPLTDLTHPFTLTLRYDESELPIGMKESDLGLYRYDTDLGNWVSLGGEVDTENNEIIVVLNHLSEFALVGSKIGTIFIPLVFR